MAFKHYFIPRASNGSHPLALRSFGLLTCLIALFILTFVNPVAGHKGHVLGYATSISTAEIYTLSNQERSQRGLGGLTQNSQLTQAAQAKAQDMFAKNYWAHAAPDGTQPWAFISASGYVYSVAGENLAKDYNTSAGVVAGWMASAPHAANVLSMSYKDVGYAVMNGTLLGQPTTLVVAMYGAPPAAAALPATPAAKPATPAPITNTTPKSAPAASAAPAETPAPTPTAVTPVQSAPKDTPRPAPQQPTTGVVLAETHQQSLPLQKPAAVYASLSWQQRASLVILSTLLVLFILKHTVVWRRQKRGYRHIWLRAYPLAQASLLAVAIILVISSGIGVVL
jgi:hypothetical protein